MTNEKYKLLDNDTINFLGKKLYRIEALKDFGNVRKGHKGGYVQSERNLSPSGNSWVFGNAKVFDNALVCGDARVFGNAKVLDNALVYGDARVYGSARVEDYAKVFGNALVSGDALIDDDACVSGNVLVSGNSVVCDGARIDNVKALITISPIGSENGTLTAYKNNKGGISVNRGGFSGTLEEFKQAVKKTHGYNKYVKTYKLAIELIKSRLEE